RRALQLLTKTEDESTRMSQLNDLYRRVHAIASGAGDSGLRTVSHFAAALEALLKELYDKPKNISSSTLRTLASSVDFLGVLVNSNREAQDHQAIRILVVDDEVLSRRAVIMALEKGGLKPVAVSDPKFALTMASESAFDLFVLDVEMPELNGFDL